nr:complement C1q protein [uncultured Mediterranean phage uvMED]
MSSILRVDDLQDSGGNSILSSNGSGTFTSNLPNTAVNTPSFFAYSNADQSVNDNTTTKVAINTEVFDSDSDYDASSNYRFTPTVAGKYFVYGQVFIRSNTYSTLRQATAELHKNGVSVSTSPYNMDNNEVLEMTSQISTVLDMNGSSDYVELYGYFDSNNSGAGTIEGHSTLARTCFGAYRIIGA